MRVSHYSHALCHDVTTLLDVERLFVPSPEVVSLADAHLQSHKVKYSVNYLLNESLQILYSTRSALIMLDLFTSNMDMFENQLL